MGDSLVHGFEDSMAVAECWQKLLDPVRDWESILEDEMDSKSIKSNGQQLENEIEFWDTCF